MASINTEINMVDKMSGPLYNINNTVVQVIYSLQNVGSAINRGFNTTAIDNARSAINKVNDGLDKMLGKIKSNTEAQEAFNKIAQQGSPAINDSKNKISDMAYSYVKQGAGKLVGISDTMTQNILQFDTVSDGLQPVEDLQDKIFASAQRSRTRFFEMTDAVINMGQKAKGIFSSNDETIAFAENLNKMFTIAGASQEEIASASAQIAQALGSGTIRADTLNGIFESTPYALQAIADYLNVPMEELNKMADKGEITGGVVKNALLGATDEINARFESVPMTWGQIWTDVVNKLTYASQPILDLISLIAQHWSILEPLVIGVATALGLYLIATKGAAAFTAIFTAVQTFLSVGFGVLTGNTKVAATAMSTYNSALLACPLTWIIMLLIAIIAIFYAVIAAINHFTGSALSATGIIAGAFAVVAAHIYNNFAVPTWNAFAAVANFLGNVFNDPVASIKILFYDMAHIVIGYVLNMARAIESVINKIPGVTIDITSGLDAFYNQLEKASQAVKDESGWVEYVGKMDYMDYEKAAGAGYKFGEGIDSKISGFFGGGKELDYDPSDLLGGNKALDYDPSGLMFNASDIAYNTNNIANNTGNIANSATISEEDLKYLRDLAEQEAVNRFTTAEIKIEQTNNNNINSDMDIDGIVDYLTIGLNEAISKSAEGVHV